MGHNMLTLNPAWSVSAIGQFFSDSALNVEPYKGFSK
jgi:hypothetical protein